MMYTLAIYVDTMVNCTRRTIYKLMILKAITKKTSKLYLQKIKVQCYCQDQNTISKLKMYTEAQAKYMSN